MIGQEALGTKDYWIKQVVNVISCALLIVKKILDDVEKLMQQYEELRLLLESADENPSSDECSNSQPPLTGVL